MLEGVFVLSYRESIPEEALAMHCKEQDLRGAIARELREARVEIDLLRERAVMAEADLYDVVQQRNRLLDKMSEYEG